MTNIARIIRNVAIASLSLGAVACMAEQDIDDESIDSADDAIAAEQSFDPKKAPCDEETSVYTNLSGKDQCVSISVTDNCEGGFDTEVTSGDATLVVPDGGTNAGTFTVANGDNITIDCEGDSEDGCCEYQIDTSGCRMADAAVQ